MFNNTNNVADNKERHF